MEQAKKVNPYVVGGSALAALAMAFLLARGMKGDDDAFGEDEREASATDSSGPASERTAAHDVRFKIPVSDMQAARGPKDALVTLVEWCDLRGTACREADAPLQALLKEYEGKLRWVHRSVADSTRPEEAKLIHQFARAAYENGNNNDRFWKVREQLLAIPDEAPVTDAELSRIAESVGMDYKALAPQLRNGTFTTVVALDMGFAARFGVRQLPAVYVNGRPVQASGPDKLKAAAKKLIEEELINARRVLATGVDKSALYDKLIEGGKWSEDDDPAKRQATTAKAFVPGAKLGEPARKP